MRTSPRDRARSSPRGTGRCARHKAAITRPLRGARRRSSSLVPRAISTRSRMRSSFSIGRTSVSVGSTSPPTRSRRSRSTSSSATSGARLRSPTTSASSRTTAAAGTTHSHCSSAPETPGCGPATSSRPRSRARTVPRSSSSAATTTMPKSSCRTRAACIRRRDTGAGWRSRPRSSAGSRRGRAGRTRRGRCSRRHAPASSRSRAGSRCARSRRSSPRRWCWPAIRTDALQLLEGTIAAARAGGEIGLLGPPLYRCLGYARAQIGDFVEAPALDESLALGREQAQSYEIGLTLVALSRLDACTGAETPRPRSTTRRSRSSPDSGSTSCRRSAFVPASHSGGRRTASA